MLADREGRLEYRPKRIKGEIFPYDNVDVEQLLVELLDCGHIDIYEVGGKKFIKILKFKEHQRIHNNEAESEIPPKPAVNYKTSHLGEQHLSPREKPLRSSLLNDECLNAECNVIANCIPEKPKPDFQVVYDRAVELLPHLAAANTGAVHGWLRKFDVCLDILPTIERLGAVQGERIRSFSFFTQAIADAFAARSAPLPQGTGPPFSAGKTAEERQQEILEKIGAKYADAS